MDNPLNILLVEDNGVFVSLATNILKGHNIIKAMSAEDGFEEFKKHQPDITFLDILLPDRNGHDVLLDMLTFNPNAFIIMMTGSREITDIEQSMQEGAQGYVTKPFSKNRLNECLEQYQQFKQGYPLADRETPTNN